MTIKPGCTVEVQDRTGVELYLVEGQKVKVLEIQDSGMLKVTDQFNDIFIPRNQVKEVKTHG
ncbi:hypothetical protein [Listeria booriae]|uniref:hypothetical protein n=1 Tax=Listeria booriae TaxID=1552123 RepID=UPI0016252190|nr:hypothetical protein [Listeria booriae]MBC1272654.1 hypothetical protein [Listeria booriae]